MGVRKPLLAVVPVLRHPTMGSEETIVNLVSVDMFVLSLRCLPFFFCIFSTSITLNSVQENCSFLSLDSLPIAMTTTRVIHPNLNWFLLYPLQAAVLVSTSCVFSHSNCVYCVTHEDIAPI